MARQWPVILLSLGLLRNENNDAPPGSEKEVAQSVSNEIFHKNSTPNAKKS
jgi:hypothetical protein